MVVDQDLGGFGGHHIQSKSVDPIQRVEIQAENDLGIFEGLYGFCGVHLTNDGIVDTGEEVKKRWKVIGQDHFDGMSELSQHRCQGQR